MRCKNDPRGHFAIRRTKRGCRIKQEVETYACAACLFFITLNSRGFTLILPIATEGTAFPNSPSALMTGRLRQMGFRAAGAAALIPSFTQEGSGSSSRSFKAIHTRHAARAQVIPDLRTGLFFYVRINKNRAQRVRFLL